MSVASHDTLLRFLRRNLEEDPLVITPLLDSGQIGGASIDVRLGNQFIVISKSSLPHIDPGKPEAPNRARYQRRIRIGFREYFDLHPHQLVLGSTLEYIGLPRNMQAHVLGKSSWGRLGLVIATATVVSPGYRGVITLELVNLGEVPIRLCPGYPIAQLTFQFTDAPCPTYSGMYQCSTGPDFSRICGDPRLVEWAPKGE